MRVFATLLVIMAHSTGHLLLDIPTPRGVIRSYNSLGNLSNEILSGVSLWGVILFFEGRPTFLKRMKWMLQRLVQHIPMMSLPVIAWWFSCSFYGLSPRVEHAHLGLKVPFFRNRLSRLGFDVDGMQRCGDFLSTSCGLGLVWPPSPLKPSWLAGDELDHQCGITTMTVVELQAINIFLLVGLSCPALLIVGTVSAWIVVVEAWASLDSLRSRHWIPRRLLVSVFVIALHRGMKGQGSLRPTKKKASWLVLSAMVISLQPELTFKNGSVKLSLSHLGAQALCLQMTCATAVAVALSAHRLEPPAVAPSRPPRWLSCLLRALSRLTFACVVVDLSTMRPSADLFVTWLLGPTTSSMSRPWLGCVLVCRLACTFAGALLVWHFFQHPANELFQSGGWRRLGRTFAAPQFRRKLA